MNKQAVVCIIENAQKQILLLRRNFAPFGWCLPGGKVDVASETLLSAIKREVKEETGLNVSDLTIIKEDIADNGLPITVFRDKTHHSHSIQLSEEHSTYIWISELLPELPLAGRTGSFLSEYLFDGANHREEEIMPWGKHKGFKISKIVELDPKYILWLHNVTKFKLTNKVVLAAKKQISDREEQLRSEESRIAMESSELNYYKDNLAKAVDTPYGRAIDGGCGTYNLIDKGGRQTGKICNWNWGWSMGSGYDSDEADDGLSF